MKKSISTFCNGDGSTSTLNQHHDENTNNVMNAMVSPSSLLGSASPNNPLLGETKPPTLEEMILQLELEEEIAKRQAKLNEYGVKSRMSCVNNADILRSARSALNQYPRFSLDGRDAMYRSSFRNLEEDNNGKRKSVCCDHDGLLRERFSNHYDKYFGNSDSIKTPKIYGGVSVVWCKPGVVAKLMGLEAMPVPKEQVVKSNVIKTSSRQNFRRRAERHLMERKLAMDLRSSGCRNMGSSCSKSGGGGGGYCVVKPVVNGDGGWPTRRFF